jgi:dTDP-4-amino-4,6-dideoxygalactose transaminase
MEKMKSAGVQTSIHYPPIHQFSAYQEIPRQSLPGLERTENLAAREMTLPLYPSLFVADVKYVVETLRDSLVELNYS